MSPPGAKCSLVDLVFLACEQCYINQNGLKVVAKGQKIVWDSHLLVAVSSVNPAAYKNVSPSKYKAPFDRLPKRQVQRLPLSDGFRRQSGSGSCPQEVFCVAWCVHLPKAVYQPPSPSICRVCHWVPRTRSGQLFSSS